MAIHAFIRNGHSKMDRAPGYQQICAHVEVPEDPVSKLSVLHFGLRPLRQRPGEDETAIGTHFVKSQGQID